MPIRPACGKHGNKNTTNAFDLCTQVAKAYDKAVWALLNIDSNNSQFQFKKSCGETFRYLFCPDIEATLNTHTSDNRWCPSPSLSSKHVWALLRAPKERMNKILSILRVVSQQCPKYASILRTNLQRWREILQFEDLNSKTRKILKIGVNRSGFELLPPLH